MDILSNIKEGFSPILLILFAIASVCLFAIAKKLGFFLFTNDKKNSCLHTNHIISFFLVYLLTNIIVPPILSKINISNKLLLVSIINIVASFIVLLSFFLIFIFLKKKDRSRILKDSNTSILSDIYFGFIFFLFSFPIIIFISQLLEGILIFLFNISNLTDQLAVQYLKQSIQIPSQFILAIIAISVLAPILEEFLFRGILQTYLKKYMKKYFAIVITSVIFSFFHFSPSQGISNVVIIGSLFILSIFLGICYEKRKSIISPIVFHSCFNSFTIITLLFKEN